MTLKLRNISRGFFLVNSVKERRKRKERKRKEMRTDSRRNYLFGGTGSSHWQNGAFSIRRMREVVSLSQHCRAGYSLEASVDKLSRLRTGEPILLLQVAGPSGSRVRDEASRERSNKGYGGRMLLWIHTHDRTFPRFDRNRGLLADSTNFSRVPYVKLKPHYRLMYTFIFRFPFHSEHGFIKFLILFNIKFSGNFVDNIVTRGVTTILQFILIFISVKDMYIMLNSYNKCTTVSINNIDDV